MGGLQCAVALSREAILVTMVIRHDAVLQLTKSHQRLCYISGASFNSTGRQELNFSC